MLRIRFLVAGAIAGLVFASPASAHPSGATAAPLAPVACTGCWVPALQSRWQYQLQGVAAYASTGGINTVISAPPAGGGAAVSPQVWDFDLYVDQAVSGNNTTLNTAHEMVMDYVEIGMTRSEITRQKDIDLSMQLTFIVNPSQ